MADTPTATSSEPPTPPSSAAEQARLRKERREAKIRAGGSARLNKITGLGGGVSRDPPPQPAPAAAASTTDATASKSTTAAPASAAAGDPDEVDISEHFYSPSSARSRVSANAPFPSAGQLDEAALRQMMLGFDTPTPPPGTNPFGTPGAGGPGGAAAEDPMMAMLQQMMGGGGMPGGAGANGSGMPSFPGMGQPGPATAEPYAYIWRVVHAVFALGLGLYIALATPFAGTKAEREATGLGYVSSAGTSSSLATVRFFWIFATAETVLQTSRFFVEKGRVQQGAVMSMLSGLLPEPYRGYLALVSRYSRIWTTVSADAMALVFVLGACAWWRSI